MVCQLALFPLSPNEMSTFANILIGLLLLVIGTASCSDTTLTNKPFLLLPMPPTSPLNNLPYTRVVVTSPNMKSKVARAFFWLCLVVFIVQNLVQLLH
jgi:hypothetical protein